MRLGSLFSGGGLGDFGFMAAGMEIAWQCEIDEYCQKILALRYPESKKYHDIKTLKGEELEKVDIITGGFPCQPFSVAGRQMGVNDDRNLWPEMRRIIQETNPSWIVCENVPGIIPIYLDTVYSDLEASGYECVAFTFSAHALGANHKRDRLWIICHAKHLGFASTKIATSIEERIYGIKKGEKETGKSKRSSEQSKAMADTKSSECTGSLQTRSRGNGASGSSKIISYCTGDPWGIFNRDGKTNGGYWATEPAVGGRIDGYPIWMGQHILKDMTAHEQIRATENLQRVWNPIISKTVWKTIGGFDRFQKSEVLLSIMRRYQEKPEQARVLMESQEAFEREVRGLWERGEITGSSFGSEERKQSSFKSPNSLQKLSRLLAHNLQENWKISSWEDGVPRISRGVKNRAKHLKMLGNAQVPACTYVVGKMIMDIENNLI